MQNEEAKKQLINTVDYGLMMDIVHLIVSFSIKNEKNEILEELKVLIKHFYAGLNEQEMTEFKDIVEKVLKPKLEQFKKELESSYPEDQAKKIFEEVIKGSNILKAE
jgi:hypothetical protein